MGVQVDDARRQHLPRRIDALLGRPQIVADRRDPSILDRQAGFPRGRPEPIDHRGVFDHHVMHVRLSYSYVVIARSAATRQSMGERAAPTYGLLRYARNDVS